MKNILFISLMLVIPFIASGKRINSIIKTDSLEISRYRADFLISKLPKADPWDARPDGSALAWGEAATLETLVDMYEATDDPAYLKEVARRGERMLSHRDDIRGVSDGSGKSRPAWSMGLKYVVAKGELLDVFGKISINIRSTPSSNNNLTIIELIPDSESRRFDLRLSNSFFKRTETFSNLSMNPYDERFIEKIVNDPLSPYTTRAGDFVDIKSNLIRVKVTGSSVPVKQSITLEPIPLAYSGYLGIIYNPLLRLAEFARQKSELEELLPAASRFIKAAEESYRDASARLWRNGPNQGEGYYLTCERGESFPADNVGQPINFLGMHTSSQLALYRLTGKKEYLERSEKMANLLKNRLQYNQDSDLYVWTYWYEPMTTTGWKPEDMLSSNVMVYKGSPNVEDSSHGVLDIAMVIASKRAGIVFTKEDIMRFSNTLLKNVILPDRSGIRRAVDGKGGDHAAYFPILHGWLELAAFNPEVYHEIRKTYLNRAQENLAFTAELLRWERKMKAISSASK
ncbi:MAG: hypothetical protein Q8S11_08805 [Daejeonella sp.]|uniref:hypothetical protein n=1 Tax=Daejeonella sp. TaxID=2805397 RepID=UPI00273628A9|nr:hypothetical protein [Daejeonella sp.]MDP3468420.1 hypothetical protein [Daejeonella sp.]